MIVVFIVLLHIDTALSQRNETRNETNLRNLSSSSTQNAPNLGPEVVSLEQDYGIPKIQVIKREGVNISTAFSKNFSQRLDKWYKTLQNASVRCGEHKISENGVSLQLAIRIEFPVFISKDYEISHEAFLPFEGFHPVLVCKHGRKTLAYVASLALLELSPLLVLCLSCAALSGIILWALDSRTNSEQFPKRFWSGILDGVWWAVVTMTTVGYGDKAPKSFLARLFATVWMISGIILLSMFTAQVTSRLTTEELKNEDHIFGKKIGVPYGFEISDYAEDVLQNSIIQDYRSTSECVKDLTNHKLDSAVIFHCDDIKVDSFEILQFLETCQVGAAMYINGRSTYWMDKAYAEYSNCMKGRTSTERNKAHKEAKRHSCKRLFDEQEDAGFSFKWVYFEDFPEYLLPLGAIIATILLTFVTGSIWDYCQKKKGANATGSLIQTRSKKSSSEDKKFMISDKHQLEMQSV